MKQSTNICVPPSNLPRIVVIGGGFAGYNCIRHLNDRAYQVVLLDRTNLHRFQPLLYQVATCGLESDSISFPLRKLFHHKHQFYFRYTAVYEVDQANKTVITDSGSLDYDKLIIASGSQANYYGMKDVHHHSITLKGISDALNIRNQILTSLEKAVSTCDDHQMDTLTNFVIAGGGPTGVEMAGSLAEFRRYILQKDYPDLAKGAMKIYLIEKGERLLSGLSIKASEKAAQQLQKLGIILLFHTSISGYDGQQLELSDGSHINTSTLIWTAGVSASIPRGFTPEQMGKGNRLVVNAYNQLKDDPNIYVLGDAALLKDRKHPAGYPMLASIAIKQAKQLALNLNREIRHKPIRPFFDNRQQYIATIGKTYAVADLGNLFLKGFIAWILWAIVHLYFIVGGKNKLMVGLNWLYHYMTYDKANRYILKNIH